jgi:hypothetical protein
VLARQFSDINGFQNTAFAPQFNRVAIIESFCHVINLTRANYKWSNQAITQLVEGD